MIIQADKRPGVDARSPPPVSRPEQREIHDVGHRLIASVVGVRVIATVVRGQEPQGIGRIPACRSAVIWAASPPRDHARPHLRPDADARGYPHRPILVAATASDSRFPERRTPCELASTTQLTRCGALTNTRLGFEQSDLPPLNQRRATPADLLRRARHTDLLAALSHWHEDDETFAPKGLRQPGVEAHDTQGVWIVLRQHQRCCSLQSV